MIINYNTELNKSNNQENIKTINKKILTLDDLDIINNNILEKNSYILIKNNDLVKRKDFNVKDFYNNYLVNHPDVDIFILSGYNEKCKDLSKSEEYEDYTFFKSRMPGEIEAFIVKSDKWENIEKLLKESKEEKINSKFKNLILNEELKAEFVWPPAFYFKNRFNLMRVCREEKENFISPRIKELSYYWFLITFIFTIIFTYLIYDKIPKDRFFYVSNKK